MSLAEDSDVPLAEGCSCTLQRDVEVSCAKAGPRKRASHHDASSNTTLAEALISSITWPLSLR